MVTTNITTTSNKIQTETNGVTKIVAKMKRPEMGTSLRWDVGAINNIAALWEFSKMMVNRGGCCVDREVELLC